MRHHLGVPEHPAGPAELDPAAFFTDGDAELGAARAQHWWAQGHGPDTARRWPSCSAGRRTARRSTDRRLSPRSFADDMVANGLSPATAAQVAPLFSRHGEEHRHLRAVLSTAFTPKKVEQLRPATRAIAERLADGIAESRRRVRVRRRLRRAAAAGGVRDPVRPPGRGPRPDGALGGGDRAGLQPGDDAGARGARRGGRRRDARVRPRAHRRQPRRTRATTSSPASSRPRSTATGCPTTTSSP